MIAKKCVGIFPTMLLLKISSLLLLVSNMAYSKVLTPAEQTIILAAHNKARGLEGSSNMQTMVWNSDLAAMAKNDSDFCTPFEGPGVNTFIFSGTKVDLNFAVTSWYKLKANYAYADHTCNGEPASDSESASACLPYLQVVWSESYQLGCAYSNCTESGQTNATLVCYYSPIVNITVQPYLKGPACTKCSSGSFFCNGVLCDNSCKAASGKCVCKAACKNCGKQTTDCKCQCSVGWRGIDCSDFCNNTHAYCGATWTTAMCKDPEMPWVSDFCPSLCGICAPSICPAGYTFLDAARGCYMIAYQALTQAQAQQKCAAKKARLAYIESQGELDAIASLWQEQFPGQAGEVAAWIGACRKNATHNDKNESFVWYTPCSQAGAPKTGTTSMSNFNVWETTPSDEPDNIGYDANIKNSGEWCVEMFNNTETSKYVWNDVSCFSVRNFYICETAATCK